jgi:proline iminopeptidase
MRERPTIILLHGGPGFDHTRFKPSMHPLAEFAQVIYLDHRSHGRSDRTSSDRWFINDWADDVRALCEALDIEKPIVMGTSFGGFVAMAYGIRHPDHPSKLILCSTAARSRLDRAYDVFERLGGKAAREAAINFWENPNDDSVREYRKICMPLYSRKQGDPHAYTRGIFFADVLFHFSAGEERTYNFLPELKRIKCPTLVIGGEQDPITPIADSEDLVAQLPKNLVRFERFADAGHGVVQDQPQRFFEVIRDFVLN